MFFVSCSEESKVNADYSFEVAKDVQDDVANFDAVTFSDDPNLDLGFYEGEVWIKLNIRNGKEPTSYVVLCNDLINRNYRFYKFDSLKNTYSSALPEDISMADHRSFRFAKPNFKIDLKANEKALYLISTTSDGRILQATPKLISLEEFLSIKQEFQSFDIIFYCFIILLLVVNLFYFRLIRSDIYFYYGAYILTGCLMYLFVEGRLYGYGLSTATIDHLMFVSIRLWILSSTLFTLSFLEVRSFNPKYFKFIVGMLVLTLGGATVYQFAYYDSSISNLHQAENLIGFVWILLSLITVGIAFKKRKIRSIYYLISYSTFLLFVTLGLIDSHATILPGDPFSYFKIGTILEFIGFTYFIALLVKHKFLVNEKLEAELSQNRTELEEKEKLLSGKNQQLPAIFKLVENSFSNEADWNDFKERFKAIDPNFVSTLSAKHPELSKSDLRLLMLIRVDYSQKEIADILNIAPDSVKKARSRVRKKLGLDESEDLKSYLSEI